MMRFLRGALAAGALALAFSACGGDTTVGRTGAGGATAAGGSAGAGGAASSCLDASNGLLSSLKACTSTADCSTLTIPTCCGSDLVVGISKDATCSVPNPDCSGLGCAKALYSTAEDGQTTENGGAIDVECHANQCRSFIRSAVCNPPVACPPGTGREQPSILCLSPNAVTANDAVSLHIVGTYLAWMDGSSLTHAIVTFDDGTGATPTLDGAPVSGCELVVQVPADTLKNAGRVQVTVSPPGAGGTATMPLVVK